MSIGVKVMKCETCDKMHNIKNYSFVRGGCNINLCNVCYGKDTPVPDYIPSEQLKKFYVKRTRKIIDEKM